MISVEIALTLFVIVAPSLVQAIVDSRPIDEQDDGPRGKQQYRRAKQGAQQQYESALPGWRVFLRVSLKH